MSVYCITQLLPVVSTTFLFSHLEAAAIIRMIAVSVAHLHAMNIAHRDLKVIIIKHTEYDHGIF